MAQYARDSSKFIAGYGVCELGSAGPQWGAAHEEFKLDNFIH
jgi:hypothetical protein